MKQDNQELYPYQTDEIDLRKLFNSIVARKFFIFGLTSFITLIAIIYALNISPVYKAFSAFTKPNNITLTNINSLEFTEETKESVFSAFLTKMSSREFQKKVFLDGGYLTLFNPENNPINDVEKFISNSTKSVVVAPPEVTKKAFDFGFLTVTPYSVSMEGANSELITKYLNELVATTNDKVINELVSNSRKKVGIRLKEILSERELLLIETKQRRLNKIVQLKDTATIARSLGIIENNFSQIGDKNTSNLIIAIGKNQMLHKEADWYLYGETALLERVNMLTNRENDEPFISELVDLNIEKLGLESGATDLTGSNAMELIRSAVRPTAPFKPNKRKIVMLAFIGGFMLSILLALVMSALKPDEEHSG